MADSASTRSGLVANTISYSSLAVLQASFLAGLSRTRIIEIFGVILCLCTKFSSWAFAFVVDICTDGDDKVVEWDIYMRLFHIFEVLMIVTNMNIGKTNLRISLVTLN